MTYVDRVAGELEVLGRSVDLVMEFGAEKGSKVRRPGKPDSQAPTDLEALSWLMDVRAAMGEWTAETDRVLSVSPKVGTPGEILRDLSFKVRVVAVKQGTVPTWARDVFRLSRVGRRLSGDAPKFVRVFETCPVCGRRDLAADPERWVLVCVNSGCRDERGRPNTFPIDAPVGVAHPVRHAVRSCETQGEAP